MLKIFNNKSFSFTEILVAVFVLSLGVSGFLMYTVSVHRFNDSIRNSLIASYHADYLLEHLRFIKAYGINITEEDTDLKLPGVNPGTTVANFTPWARDEVGLEMLREEQILVDFQPDGCTFGQDPTCLDVSIVWTLAGSAQTFGVNYNTKLSSYTTLPVCGNNVTEIGEECDDGNDIYFDACIDCVVAVCGDGYIKSLPPSPPDDEECDDGNTIPGDGCSAACTIEPICGNGFQEVGEQCDDGKNGDDTDYCYDDCTSTYCGDNITQAVRGEQCDDGNTSSSDYCVYNNIYNQYCQEAYCGDGRTKTSGQSPPPNEACDSGPNNGRLGYCNDECTAMLPDPGCGNSIVEPGEDCDDGNSINTDACVDCEDAECGDGHIWAGVEECDDGNSSDYDLCTNACENSTCGDGIRQPSNGEECDMGGYTSCCYSNCQFRPRWTHIGTCNSLMGWPIFGTVGCLFSQYVRLCPASHTKMENRVCTYGSDVFCWAPVLFQPSKVFICFEGKAPLCFWPICNPNGCK